MALAREIAARNPNGVRGAKRLFNRMFTDGAAEQFAEERRVIRSLIGTPNQVEAITANLEGRPPAFTDDRDSPTDAWTRSSGSSGSSCRAARRDRSWSTATATCRRSSSRSSPATRPSVPWRAPCCRRSASTGTSSTSTSTRAARTRRATSCRRTSSWRSPIPRWTPPDGWHDVDVSRPTLGIEPELAPRLAVWIDERLGRAVPDPLRAPWTRPGWYERACAWIERALADAPAGAGDRRSSSTATGGSRR